MKPISGVLGGHTTRRGVVREMLRSLNFSSTSWGLPASMAALNAGAEGILYKPMVFVVVTFGKFRGEAKRDAVYLYPGATSPEVRAFRSKTGLQISVYL